MLRERLKEILKVSRDMKDEQYHSDIDVIADSILSCIRQEDVKLLEGLIIKATNEVKLVGSTFDYTKEKVVYVSDIFQEINRIKGEK